MTGILIRPEENRDIEAIRRVTKAAFAPMAYSSQTEAEIIDALRAAGALTISLAAVEAGEVIGHIAFSPVTIDGKDTGWFGLGPISVDPGRQKQGIGSRLMREGLSRLQAMGAKGCVLLGDPGYYRRFGFDTDASLVYEGAPAEYFMRLAFESPVPAGKVSFHEGFGAS